MTSVQMVCTIMRDGEWEEPTLTPEFWAIIGVGVALTGVGVSGLGLGFLAYRGLHADIASLRERMAKLEGAMDGFTKGVSGNPSG